MASDDVASSICRAGPYQLAPPQQAGGEDGEGVHRLAPHAPRAREICARGGIQPLENLRVEEVGEGLEPGPYTHTRP
jgi:hypothetical protein